MNSREYAEHLGISQSTVKRWLREGLPAKRFGRDVNIQPADADPWVKANRRKSVSFNRQSLVYVVQRGADGALRFGWTSDIIRRLRELRRDERDSVTLVAALPGESARVDRLYGATEISVEAGLWVIPSAKFDPIAALIQATCSHREGGSTGGTLKPGSEKKDRK